MTLADLIDLEAQLARDREADPGAVEARDRALLRGRGDADARTGNGRRDARPGPLLAAWLERLRGAEPGRLHPGRTVAGALRALRASLAVAGLALGWGAAAAVLRYTGAQPVNVWDFLLVFVGVQLLLLALLLVSFLLPVASLGLPLLGLFRGLFAAVYPRLAARGLHVDAARAAEWSALWHGLRSRRSLYHHLEPWLLLGLTQAFGVAFNLGALLGCLRAIAFSDLAFAWSTTLLQLDPGRFHALVHALAAPFGALWPDAVPSRALVDATRYSRLDAAYVGATGGRAADAALVGGWWPFLVSCLAAYGLLPRLVTLALASGRSALLLRRLPLDDAAVRRVLRRLEEPHVDTRATLPEAAPPAPAPAPARPGPDGGAARGRCAAVLWRDVPRRPEVEAAVARQARAALGPVVAAGGRDFDEGAVDWPRALDGADPVVLVAEAFEAPDRAALRLLRDLRGAAGPRRQLVVLLVDGADAALRPPERAQVRTWEEGLAALEDPYLAVEALAPAGPPTASAPAPSAERRP